MHLIFPSSQYLKRTSSSRSLSPSPKITKGTWAKPHISFISSIVITIIWIFITEISISTVSATQTPNESDLVQNSTTNVNITSVKTTDYLTYEESLSGISPSESPSSTTFHETKALLVLNGSDNIFSAADAGHQQQFSLQQPPEKRKHRQRERSNNGNGNKRKRKKDSQMTTDWTLIPFIIPSSTSEDEGQGSDSEDDGNDDDDPLDLVDLIDLYETADVNQGVVHPPENTDENIRAKPNKLDSRPNIILILTDDQDVELGSMEYMPETLKVFRDQGIEFRHGYVTTPMCCPSRSSMLTGLYVHNHQVYTNNDNCSSTDHWRENYEKKTFASYLWDSGYYTSYIGKYLNKYDGSHIPYGWDEWNALLMNSKFFNYTVNRNGVKIRYGNNYQHDYYPNSIANDTINFLQRMAYVSNIQKHGYKASDSSSEPGSATGSGSSTTKKHYIQQPFLLVVSFPSPHGPEDSAPEYSNLFLNTTSHHTPSYNYAPNSDKQWILRRTSKMNPTLRNFTNLLMSKRLQTLQSVDLAVKNIVRILRETGLMDNTFVFYTSDHGYHVGQFGLIKGKAMPFEFDIRVPFYLTTPKGLLIPSGTMINEPVLNIDLAPTFLELANLPIPNDMDGRSFVPLLKKYSRDKSVVKEDLHWTQSFLIESSGRRESHGRSSITKTQPETSAAAYENGKKSAAQTSASAAAAERFLIDNETTATELALCQLHPYPCQYGQKKYCRTEKNRIRFRKCRPNTDFIVAYDIVGNINGQVNGSKQCICPVTTSPSPRVKRSNLEAELISSSTANPLTTTTTVGFNWEIERKRIDEEIEILKIRIDALRERRRLLRRQWMMNEQILEQDAAERLPQETEITTSSTGSSISGAQRIKGHKLGKNGLPRNRNHEEQQHSAFVRMPSSSVGISKRKKISNRIHNNAVPLLLSPVEIEPETTTLFPVNNANVTSNTVLDFIQGGSDQITFQRSSEAFDVYEEDDDDDPEGFGHDHDHDHEEEEFDDDNEGDDEEFPDYTTAFLVPSVPNRGNQGESHFEGNVNERINNNQEGRLKTSSESHKSNRKRLNGMSHNNNSTQQQHERNSRRKKGNKGHTEESTVSTISPDSPIITEECDCNNGINNRPDLKWLRQREREERKRRKLLSKLRKKQRFLHRINDPTERHQAETCGSEDKMNCFWHDQSHWRTEPKWRLDSFCFCMNAFNNSFSCIRTINDTHNFLYCHFITGFKMYFDLNQDPYQLQNTIGSLSAHEEDHMLDTLLKLKQCNGRKECLAASTNSLASIGSDEESLESSTSQPTNLDSLQLQTQQQQSIRTSKELLEPSIWERIFGRWRKKQRKHRNHQHQHHQNGRQGRKHHKHKNNDNEA